MTLGEDNSTCRPVVAVGAVVMENGRVLLVRRKNPPSEGLWAIPGGKQRWGETLQQTAEREVLEETGVRIKAGKIVHTFEVLDHDAGGSLLFHYIIIDVTGKYISGRLHAGDDALEARWFARGELERSRTSPSTLKLLEEKFKF